MDNFTPLQAAFLQTYGSPSPFPGGGGALDPSSGGNPFATGTAMPAAADPGFDTYQAGVSPFGAWGNDAPYSTTGGYGDLAGGYLNQAVAAQPFGTFGIGSYGSDLSPLQGAGTANTWMDAAQLSPTQLAQAQISPQFQPQKAPAPGSPGALGGSGLNTAAMTGNSGWTNVAQWSSMIEQASAQTGVPANLIAAVMREESGGVNADDPNSGAMGLMQVMPDGGWLGTPISAAQGHDPATNILLGAEELLTTYNGPGNHSWYDALRYYHGIGWDGNTTDTQYADAITAYANELGGIGTGSTTGVNAVAGNLPSGQVAGGFGSATPGTATRGNGTFVADAMAALGDAYVWDTHGDYSNPNAAGQTFDCSGLVGWAYYQATGVDIGTGSHYQIDLPQQGIGQYVNASQTDWSQLEPGDLVFWDTEGGTEVDNGNTASHVAIYIGNGQVVEAADAQLGVITASMASMNSQYQFLAAVRLPNSASAAMGAAVGGAAGAAGVTQLPWAGQPVTGASAPLFADPFIDPTGVATALGPAWGMIQLGMSGAQAPGPNPNTWQLPG